MIPDKTITVSELKKALADFDDDDYVSISVETPSGYICPDGAIVELKKVVHGIDWHAHEVILIPRVTLQIKDVDKWVRRK